MRHHNDPTKCPKPGRQLKPRRPPQPRQPSQARGRCTRYVAVHPNRRGALPTDRVHCPNTQEQTRNWHTEPLTATPLHAQLGPTGGRMGTPPTPPPALRPTPAQSDTSYTLTCEEPDIYSATIQQHVGLFSPLGRLSSLTYHICLIDTQSPHFVHTIQLDAPLLQLPMDPDTM